MTLINSTFTHRLNLGGKSSQPHGTHLSISGNDERKTFTVRAYMPGDDRAGEPDSRVELEIPCNEFWTLITKLPGAPT